MSCQILCPKNIKGIVSNAGVDQKKTRVSRLTITLIAILLRKSSVVECRFCTHCVQIKQMPGIEVVIVSIILVKQVRVIIDELKVKKIIT